MSEPLARAEQIADAIALVRGLLGDRDATRVSVEVTRGGTYRIEAEASEGKAMRHQFGTGRKAG